MQQIQISFYYLPQVLPSLLSRAILLQTILTDNEKFLLTEICHNLDQVLMVTAGLNFLLIPLSLSLPIMIISRFPHLSNTDNLEVHFIFSRVNYTLQLEQQSLFLQFFHNQVCFSLPVLYDFPLF